MMFRVTHKYKNLGYLLITFLWLGIELSVSAASATEVKSIRMWPAPDSTRLVFDLSAPIDHSLFSLKSPNRIVVDLNNARLRNKPKLNFDNAHVKAIRTAPRNRNDLRIVLDLNAKVRPKSFLLKPNRQYGHRLVIDLVSKEKAKSTPKPRHYKNTKRDIIVAIDAGHGGDDPGAIGRRGTREKTVVLAIARELKKIVDKQPGMKGKLVRNGDYFVSLKKRVQKARDVQADLFISIHADAFKDRRARGSSVFVLSENGASSEVARFLAESENNSDLIGGVLGDKDPLLKQVLVDMLKNSTMEDSNKVARHMVKGLKGVTRMHKSHVEQAGFRVLKAPDIPSVLIETAFISNPGEEKKLRSRKHQRKLARAIFKGTLNYFKTNPPPGTLLAMKKRKHRIASGDTLSEIAEQYQVTIAGIRRLNKLKSDRLHVGKVLTIPGFVTSDS